MSRLDDELRLAFRRQEPPPDFLERVLAEVARPQVAKTNWWQVFLSFFHAPRFKWVAIGFATALVVVIGSLQYQNVQQSAGSEETARTLAAPAVAPSDDTNKPPVLKKPDSPQQALNPTPSPRRPDRQRRRAVPASHLASNQEKKEGEAAKERLMLALHIASATLNEAQKIMRED